MSEAVKALALKYYPTLWDKARIDALLATGKLTQDEYDEIIASVATQ